MSENRRRPASRLFSELEMQEATTFVNMRELVLATEPEAIVQLEALTGTTQADAMLYFQHVHPWEPPERAALDSVGAREQTAIIRSALSRSRHGTVLYKPEA